VYNYFGGITHTGGAVDFSDKIFGGFDNYSYLCSHLTP